METTDGIFNRLPKDWREQLAEELHKPYLTQLDSFVAEEYRHHVCYPPLQDVFRAFELCPFSHLQVVLLGQDPYHEPKQAHGLCFSVEEGVKLPPSLRNIFKELESDLGKNIPAHGDLSNWARQGVFMLNATLTVREHQANSHAKSGWETFTDAVIKHISEQKDHVVFILWGNYAQQKAQYINEQKHLVLRSAHPSPLSAYHGFFNNHHFSLTNAFLAKHQLSPIKW